MVEYFDWRFAIPAFNKAPLSLLLVSHYWRDVARSIPWLWTSIVVGARHQSQQGILGVEAWLERSADLPLDLHISAETSWGSSPVSDHLLTTLLKRSRRFRTFEVMDVPSDWTATVLMELDHHLPNLECINIHLNPQTFEDWHHWILEVPLPKTLPIRSAPKLSTLTTNSLTTPIHSLGLPLSAITKLQLNVEGSPIIGMSIDDCLETLIQCPSIKWCYLGITGDGFVRPDRTPIILRNLLDLSLCIFRDIDISTFLIYLTLPALRSLKIQEDDHLVL